MILLFDIGSLINLTEYTKFQQVLFFLDALFWFITYALIERNVRKYKYIGIPAFSVMHNIAWEFTWSFLFVTQLGDFFVWGIRIWFITDVLLLVRLLQFGRKQLTNKWLIDNFTWLTFLGVGFWIALYCGFLYQYSDPIGAVTGYAINVIMSLLFIGLFLKQPEQKALSLDIAIFKMFGTGFVGFALAIGDEKVPFVVVMAILTFIIDMTYCVMLMNRKKFIQLKNGKA